MSRVEPPLLVDGAVIHTLRRSVLLLALVFWASIVVAQDEVTTSPYSDAELVTDRLAVQPGEAFDVALRLVMEDGWHSYWVNSGDSGLQTRITWDLPAGVEVGEIRWPFPERVDTGSFTTYAYYDEVYLLTEVTVADDFRGNVLPLAARADWLICADVCLPAYEEVSLEVAIGDDASRSAHAEALDNARSLLPIDLPEGWSAEAETTDDGYVVRISHPPAWSGDASGIDLFAAESGVVRHAARHPVTPSDGGFTIDVERSEYARAPVAVFQAVLVADGSTRFHDDAQALRLDVPVIGVEEPVAALEAPADARGVAVSIWLALVFAFIGGLLLNLMPCVFPILSIKILGFANGNGSDRRTMRKHGSLFGVGVLVSFLLLAALLLLLRAGGESLGWGFQLQNPLIVAGLALLMFAIGLNLLGVFEVGMRLGGIGGRLDRGDGASGAFWSGVLATIVATPCTAPFMGASLGWALAQPASSALMVFTALGLGMATPFVLLSYFPGWMQRLPRPGEWMITLKQVLSFGMFATALWLIWVFGLQTGIDGMVLLLAAMTLIGFAGWLLNRWSWVTATARVRVVTRALASVALVLALLATLAGSRHVNSAGMAPSDAWQPFDPDRVEEIVQTGQPVFVDFTAAWCITCQVNKRVALQHNRVVQAFASRNVALMQADWTSYDPVITAALEEFGRSGVPLYVLYPGGNADPVILPEILSPGIVLDALNRIAPTTASVP